MQKFIYCILCCGAPPSNRPVRGKSSVVKTSDKLVEQANFKSLLGDEKNEKDYLLENQIQAPNKGAYGSQGSILNSNSEQVIETQGGDTSEQKDLLIGATPAQEIARNQPNSDALIAASSVSPMSSIDAGKFRENLDPESNVSGFLKHGEMMGKDVGRPLSPSQGTAEGSTAGQVSASGDSNDLGASTSKETKSTTKIGSYARIEYSPIDDLESVTTKSYSRVGSEKSSRRQTGRNSHQTSPSEKSSRRSSQGIESTSISIASQLSNEQLQQNLTNMLESANSPISTFGTIGLPLGPPLNYSNLDTGGKTTPETTGAALTSGSQESLSEVPPPRPMSRNEALPALRSPGAALTSDSMEEDTMANVKRSTSWRKSLTGPFTGKKSPIIGISGQTLERVGSPTSNATSSSGDVANPTPTPSELSGTSSKRKLRLRPKALLKKLRPGKKKNKDGQKEEKAN